jgi:hypothetical protein
MCLAGLCFRQSCPHHTERSSEERREEDETEERREEDETEEVVRSGTGLGAALAGAGRM